MTRKSKLKGKRNYKITYHDLKDKPYPWKKNKPPKERTKQKIIYDVKIDRFREYKTGRYVTNIVGLFEKAAARAFKEADKNGERESWQDKLRRKMKKKGIKIRKRILPKFPSDREKFEFGSKAGAIDDHLDNIIYRNLEYMDEEVTY